MSTDQEPPTDGPPAASEEQLAAELPPKGPVFVVVGIGASAGGLEAFIDLLQGLPPDPGLALLFVNHLEPHRKSQLAEILAQVTPLRVREAAEGMAVEANHVYVLPPDYSMALTDGSLTLTPRPLGRAAHVPIDVLFRSLAEVLKSRAVGVLLSGGGTDGTLGCHEIKASGGITFAQDEATAQQVGMPRSAISEGCIDYVLPPPQIAQQLVRIARHPYNREATGAVPHVSDDGIAEVIDLLRAHTDVDFTHYKRTTVRRRILRRMALRGLEDIDSYLTELRGNPTELQALYADFLIRVTQFFRDPEAFDTLKAKVLPALVQDRPPDVPIRFWVAGCSTGEEVYSLSICLLEFLEDRPGRFPIKILATDLNEASLEKARAGVYIENIETDVSAERLRRFFVRVDGHYQISKAVRDLCVFSRHNMATDPPFSHLDLVSCRNVLIYLDQALQKRVIPVLHYSLKPGGFLFLGGSENLGGYAEMFSPVDAKHRLFAKRPGPSGAVLDFGRMAFAEGSPLRVRPEKGPHGWTALDLQREADRIVLNRYAPVGVVIDEALTVLQFRGRTAPYLEPAPGMASLDLLRMVREGLLAEVRWAVNKAKADNAAVVREGLWVKDGDKVWPVKLEVIPFKLPAAGGTRFFLVLFQDLPTADERRAEEPAAAPPLAAEHQVNQLQQELAALREYLQTVIEEQESTNEELKSANEEILSANEELQSTNEELQTAKEEAVSANEELATVNDELRHRNAELARVNDDLINILNGVNIPIVLVSRDLRVRRFTPPAEKVFNLIPSDIGRPLGDLKTTLEGVDLVTIITGVISAPSAYEGEVRDARGSAYLLRVRPYVTTDNKIDGASVVLLDIDLVKRLLGKGG